MDGTLCVMDVHEGRGHPLPSSVCGPADEGHVRMGDAADVISTSLARVGPRVPTEECQLG